MKLTRPKRKDFKKNYKGRHDYRVACQVYGLVKELLDRGMTREEILKLLEDEDQSVEWGYLWTE